MAMYAAEKKLVFWLNPRMTTRLLAFNLVMTAYVVLGSVHAEAHLLRFYGDAYRGYQEQVPLRARRTSASYPRPDNPRHSISTFQDETDPPLRISFLLSQHLNLAAAASACRTPQSG